LSVRSMSLCCTARDSEISSLITSCCCTAISRVVILASRHHHQPAHAVRTTKIHIEAFARMQVWVHRVCKPRRPTASNGFLYSLRSHLPANTHDYTRLSDRFLQGSKALLLICSAAAMPSLSGTVTVTSVQHCWSLSTASHWASKAFIQGVRIL
jgi:hypothetical protein